MELTKAEEQVMRVLWKRQSAFVKDIIDDLPEPKPAYNTVGTFLKILENKGFVVRKKYGNSFEYSPTVTKAKYTNHLIKGMVTKFFDGSSEKMLSHFLKTNDIDLQTFEELNRGNTKE